MTENAKDLSPAQHTDNMLEAAQTHLSRAGRDLTKDRTHGYPSPATMAAHIATDVGRRLQEAVEEERKAEHLRAEIWQESIEITKEMLDVERSRVAKLEKALRSILESANKALDYPGGISLEGYAAVSLWNIHSRAGVALVD